VIKVEDVAYARFRAPDLLKMKEFLLDFGLHEAEDSTSTILRMRGTGEAPFVHVTELGHAGFVAVGLRAASLEDLRRLADIEMKTIADLDGDHGGQVLRLLDPNGFVVEVIAGQQSVPTLPDGSRSQWNSLASRQRISAVKRVKAGAATVRRLGHMVFKVNDVAETWNWWQSRFGLLMSDEVRAPDGSLVAVFVRCDRGEAPVDHHTFNFASVPGKTAGFHHAAFEVADLDDLMVGHDLLKSKGYISSWGVGRHILGSQVFDYWEDPWGHRLEHWTDGDLLRNDSAPTVADIPTMMGHQWGPSAPADFV
jgi:catechol 2,3-dioxygenase-like lactoylglutathione lyase family enzyme